MKPSDELRKIADDLAESSEIDPMGGSVTDLSSDEYQDLDDDTILIIEGSLEKESAEYKGKKVKLNKPRYLRKGEPGYGKKQYVVYVKKDDGKVKRITFGDANLRAKPSDPKARESFRARHRCHLKTDKTTPGYWACRFPANW